MALTFDRLLSGRDELKPVNDSGFVRPSYAGSEVEHMSLEQEDWPIAASVKVQKFTPSGSLKEVEQPMELLSERAEHLDIAGRKPFGPDCKGYREQVWAVVDVPVQHGRDCGRRTPWVRIDQLGKFDSPNLIKIKSRWMSLERYRHCFPGIQLGMTWHNENYHIRISDIPNVHHSGHDIEGYTDVSGGQDVEYPRNNKDTKWPTSVLSFDPKFLLDKLVKAGALTPNFIQELPRVSC